MALARKSEYFYRAFSSQFSVHQSGPLLLISKIDTEQVATSNEVDLGEDEDPDAIRAMIRHMYDLPYDQMLVDNTANDSAAYSTNEDLLFHIGVFTAADKYDVASLRPLVVKKFESLMETNWEGENFAASIQKLTGPSAGHLADNTLQAAAAAFCSKHLIQLVDNDAFVKMVQQEEPFTGRLLTDFLRVEEHTEGCPIIQVKTCKRPVCLNIEPSEISRLNTNCIACGANANTYASGLVDYKKVCFL
jgi:hypothetical protein